MKKEAMRSIIGERILKERQARQLTREELAEILGISPGHLGLIERGERGTTYFMLFKLAEVFQMSIDDLYKSEDLSYSNAKERKLKKLASIATDFRDEEIDHLLETAILIRKINDGKIRKLASISKDFSESEMDYLLNAAALIRKVHDGGVSSDTAL